MNGLERVAEPLLPLALQAIAIDVTPVDECELAIGASKMGGLPDLPEHALWPGFRGRPMGFVAQINLREAAPYDVDGVLPPAGVLSFFYIDPNEDDPNFEDAASVLYFDAEPSSFERRQAPMALLEGPGVSDSGLSVFRSCSMRFAPFGTLPNPNSGAIKALLSPDEWTAYITTYVGTPYENEPAHWLLGYPFSLEGDALTECYVETHRHDPSSWLRSIDERALTNLMIGHGDPHLLRRLEIESADWRHLLQVYSNDEAGMDWTGGGVLHFCIRSRDLQARAFDYSWLEFNFSSAAGKHLTLFASRDPSVMRLW
jgi:hypothetical protein